MKISIPCVQCMNEHAFAPDLKLPFSDSGIYHTVCPNGHDCVLGVKNPKYEILFESAIEALSNEYYFESVAGFAASLERFMEFFIRIMCKKRPIGQTEFDKTWKIISSQSERQIGAFCFLYLYVLGEFPKLLHPKQVEFRNSVIHKGNIPKREDAVRYGINVYQVITETSTKLIDSLGLTWEDMTISFSDTSFDHLPSAQMLYSCLPLSLSRNFEDKYEPCEKVFARFLT